MAAVFGASGTDLNEAREGALRGILQQTAGGSANADKAIALAQQLYPDTPKADPYEAAFQFFAEMGRQASQPGATVLSSAVGSMQVPMDYLNAKKKEAEETERARMTTALSLGPSLKPKEVGKGGYINVMVDGEAQVLTSAEIQAAKKAGKTVSPYEKPSASTSTFKERKFYKTGFPAAVVKNETDAASFEADGWSAVPPEGWSESVDADGFETQTSQILDGGLIVFAGKDGTSRVIRAGSNEEVTGQEALDAIKEAQDLGVDLQTRRAGGRRAAVVAVNTSLSAFDQVSKSRSNIANLQEAKRLVLEEGANTGVIADRLPNWKASTVALDTVKNELGLDVVGSVTFGALSQGELTLALNTALPTNLNEDALVDWIDRKIAAQRKLQDYLYAQARFLSAGDKTLADWLDEAEARQEERERIAASRAQAGTNFDFPTMTESEILEVDIDALDSDQFDAFEKRMKELGLYE
jgi:hypothetical protein